MDTTIKLGISSCLLGQRLRYDGGHKLDRFLVNTLGQFVEYVPVCPEVECGFGIPREAFRLTGDPQSPRLITSKTKKDVTERMVKWAKKRVVDLEGKDLCGFIFKSRSPSSGMERVKVYNEQGMPAKRGTGIFAGIFMAHFPLIPVEEDGRLHDPKIRENFIERVFAMKRWRDNLRGRRNMGKLVNFHAENKLLILSHSQKHYRVMGKLVGEGKGMPLEELYHSYENLLMEALKLKTTVKKNINVIQHMMGYFKRDLTSDEKKELMGVIEIYRKGDVPLIVPLTLINHYVRKYSQPYLRVQTYLHPHPSALQLRNHV
jgi:uncharacterized protein YbgA (DUF1722 family)/uncharacterized protein YbbK (DUF523 family)